MILARSTSVQNIETPFGGNITELRFEVYLGATLLYSGTKTNYDLSQNLIEFDFSIFARDLIIPKIVQEVSSVVLDTNLWVELNVALEFTNGVNTFGALGYDNATPLYFVYGYLDNSSIINALNFDYSNSIAYDRVVLMNKGTYEYLSPQAGGSIWVDNFTNLYSAKYTPLNGGASVTIPNAVVSLVGYPTVHSSFISVGNKLEILDPSDDVIWTGTFKPIEECKHTPLKIDFINNYGGWQRMWLFKANYQSISQKKEQFTRGFNYHTTINGDSPTKVFNVETMNTYRGNTGFVKDDFNTNVLVPLVNSETIFVNDRPCILKTSNIDLVKHINENMINYTLEFEESFNTIYR